MPIFSVISQEMIPAIGEINKEDSAEIRGRTLGSKLRPQAALPKAAYDVRFESCHSQAVIH